MSKTIESDDAIPRSDGTVLSLIGQNAENDFPVLKAFQQYIDAEQAKARKRMLGLSIFFIMLLVAVVVTFTIVMMSVINRNQALSDRLLEIALRERPAQAATTVSRACTCSGYDRYAHADHPAVSRKRRSRPHARGAEEAEGRTRSRTRTSQGSPGEAQAGGDREASSAAVSGILCAGRCP